MRDPKREPDTDSLVSAISDRLLSGVSVAASTAQLALAETRLAATSAGLILAIVLFLTATAIVCWLLLAALLAYGLWALGMAVSWVLLLLLLLHVLLAGALLLVVRRLARNVQFRHTRDAIGLRRDFETSTLDTSVEPRKPHM